MLWLQERHRCTRWSNSIRWTWVGVANMVDLMTTLTTLVIKVKWRTKETMMVLLMCLIVLLANQWAWSTWLRNKLTKLNLISISSLQWLGRSFKVMELKTYFQCRKQHSNSSWMGKNWLLSPRPVQERHWPSCYHSLKWLKPVLRNTVETDAYRLSSLNQQEN